MEDFEMFVEDLNREQFEELREAYFYELFDSGECEEIGCSCPEDIPDSVIDDHYAGVEFSADDFFCTAGM